MRMYPIIRLFRPRSMMLCGLCLFVILAAADCTPAITISDNEKKTETQSHTENQSAEKQQEQQSNEPTAETSQEPAKETTSDAGTDTDPREPSGNEAMTETTQETGPIPCKTDCDCVKTAQACESSFCADVDRANMCPSCEDPNTCVTGQPCVDKNGAVSTCPDVACANDCDCLGVGMVCQGNVCAPLKRANQCPPCESPQCFAGNSCYQHDGTISKCPGTGMGAACKHDCDCLKYGLLCDGTNGCRALRRISFCKACSDATCTSGDPCFNPDKTIGTCAASTTCKHDCDCVKQGQVCDTNGTCASLRRPSLCLACTDVNCKTDDPCLNKDGSIGSCCCTVSGCGQGMVCCSGGAPPPPNTCGRFCTQPDPKTGQCPLFP
ncbi:MAG: hypothetical protein H6728_16690 [Myxococcales bacterium]|nr:hypothetical protein [Myxococcales bacterium]